MSKHTPGPWKVEYDFDAGHVIRMGKAILDRSNYPVEEIIHYEHGLSANEDTPKTRAQFRRAEANARLIAAAPELLEALRGLLAQQRQGSPGTCRCDACGAARDAIKKATGEPK